MMFGTGGNALIAKKSVRESNKKPLKIFLC